MKQWRQLNRSLSGCYGWHRTRPGSPRKHLAQNVAVLKAVVVFEVIGHFFSPFQRGLLPTAPLWQRWRSRLKNWFCVALICRCQLYRQVGPKTVRRGSQGLRRHLVAVKLTIGEKIMKPMGGVLGTTAGDPAVQGFFSERAMSCFNKFSQRVIGFHTLVSFFRQLHCRLDALIYTTTACRMQYLFQTIFNHAKNQQNRYFGRLLAVRG